MPYYHISPALEWYRISRIWGKGYKCHIREPSEGVDRPLSAFFLKFLLRFIFMTNGDEYINIRHDAISNYISEVLTPQLG